MQFVNLVTILSFILASVLCDDESPTQLTEDEICSFASNSYWLAILISSAGWSSFLVATIVLATAAIYQSKRRSQIETEFKILKTMSEQQRRPPFSHNPPSKQHAAPMQQLPPARPLELNSEGFTARPMESPTPPIGGFSYTTPSGLNQGYVNVGFTSAERSRTPGLSPLYRSPPRNSFSLGPRVLPPKDYNIQD